MEKRRKKYERFCSILVSSSIIVAYHHIPNFILPLVSTYYDGQMANKNKNNPTKTEILPPDGSASAARCWGAGCSDRSNHSCPRACTRTSLHTL